MIPYARQDISQQDIEAVITILQSDRLTQGPAIDRFERLVADYCGAAHAVAANSATSALHLACRALGLGLGDLLWTSPNTFVASANCALYCGAAVDFVDIDPDTYNMSIEALRAKLEQAKRDRRLPKIVVPVHFSGQPCDMPAIAELARHYGFFVVEDASHAIGARCRGQPVGNGEHADVAVFSFHPAKIVTTGEGGMAVTSNPELARRMRLLRSHGVTRDAADMEEPNHDPWYYEQRDLGYNYRLTDIQAALGESQMKRLPAFLARRRELASCYDRLLVGLPLRLPYQEAWAESAWHLYVIQIGQEAQRSRAEVFACLREEGIGVNVHYIPVHTQPWYRRLGFDWNQFPEAEAYYRRALSLPLFPALTEVEQDRVVAALRRALV